MKLSSFFAFTVVVVAAAEAASQQQRCVDFFFSKTCPHCAVAKPFVDALEKDPSLSVSVVRHETYAKTSESLRATALLWAAYDAYGWDGARGVPTVFVGGLSAVLVGSKTVSERLNATLFAACPGVCECLDADELLNDTASSEFEGQTSSLGTISAMLVAAVAALGAAAGLPPSLMALFAALLRGFAKQQQHTTAADLSKNRAYALVQDEESFEEDALPQQHSPRVFHCGLLFVAVCFAVYSVVPFAFAALFQAIGSAWILLGFGALALLAGGFHVKSALCPNEGCNLGAPTRFMSRLEAWLGSFDSFAHVVPAALACSCAVLPITFPPMLLLSALSALCCGSLLGELLLCVVFGVVALLPLLAASVSLRASRSKSINDVEEFHRAQHRTLYLVPATCLFAVGVLAILNSTISSIIF